MRGGHGKFHSRKEMEDTQRKSQDSPPGQLQRVWFLMPTRRHLHLELLTEPGWHTRK